jgi:hypothetical protein
MDFFLPRAILCARSVFHVLERFRFDRTVKLAIEEPAKNALEDGNASRRVSVLIHTHCPALTGLTAG